MNVPSHLILREKSTSQVRCALRRSPVVGVLGPRQAGKSTLARGITVGWAGPTHFFDLEDPGAAEALSAPMAVLGPLSGLVVIDEIQRQPSLFPVLRVLADRAGPNTRYLVLGSAAPELMRDASESLAGRIEFVAMSGFNLVEVGPTARDALWLRGGFPRSFLAANDADSLAWREAFVQTFLERDLPQLGLRVPSLSLRRFWTMVAHHHAQSWNSAEIGASMGLDEKTIRRYLDILAGAFVVRLLPPWFENLGKRQRKAPKVYVRDSGLLHALLGVETMTELTMHPKLGASWEGFALEHVAACFKPGNVYFWSVHSGPEVDMVAFDGPRRVGFEFKFSDRPSLTDSMKKAKSLLSLQQLSVVYPGERRYPLADGIDAVPLAEVLQTYASHEGD